MKVTDYGLSLLVNKGFTAGATPTVVEIMTNSAGAAGPTRWMAPESILRRIYSKKTDVWAFGVFLYEVWTLAMIPYYLISDDREVARMVVNGERLQQPDSCPDHVYVIMQECWRTIHKDRPSVSENTDQTARGVCGRKSGGLQDRVCGVPERGVRHGTLCGIIMLR